MKGASALAVFLVLVIIGIVVYYGYTQGWFQNVFTDGIGPRPTYSNNIITIQGKTVDTTAPFSGASTTLSFEIKNNGDKTVDYVEVDFTNIPGEFSEIDLTCELTEPTVESGIEKKCVYQCVGSSESSEKCIPSQDSRQISATLKAKEDIEATQSVKLEYEVNYFYSGYREIRIPIVGKDVKSLPTGARFVVSEPTYGPVQVDITAPIGVVKEEGSARVTENYAREDREFTMKFNFKNVGNSRNEIYIKPENLKFEFEDLQFVTCDRWDAAENKLIEKEKLPFTIECTLQETVNDKITLYETGVVKIRLDTYEYTLKESETFTIRKKS